MTDIEKRLHEQNIRQWNTPAPTESLEKWYIDQDDLYLIITPKYRARVLRGLIGNTFVPPKLERLRIIGKLTPTENKDKQKLINDFLKRNNEARERLSYREITEILKKEFGQDWTRDMIRWREKKCGIIST